MRYGSVCSGIGTDALAFHPLGWETAFFSEIEPFPSALLAHRFPDISNLGDFTQIGEEHGPIDLLCGGTPCQSFSVAGKRLGLDDPRGNLAIEFLRLAQRVRARWLLWENVPGVLSSSDGRDFHAFLSLMGQCGYGYAYRVLDAQYFGVAQRRRRVFVIGYFGDWRPAAAVLFEHHSLSRNTAPSRKAGQRVTGTIEAGLDRSRGAGTPTNALTEVAYPVRTSANRWMMDGNDNLITHTPTQCYDSSEDGCGRGVPTIVHENMSGNLSAADHARALRQGASHSYQFVIKGAANGRTPEAGPQRGEILDDGTAYTLDATDVHAIAFQQNTRDEVRLIDGDGDLAGALSSEPGMHQQNCVATTERSQVRRLTPVECERLQGLPDNWTNIPYKGKPAADGPRYRAIGNGWALPVPAWIGKRIDMVEELLAATTIQEGW